MPTLEQIRAAIVSQIESVADIGPVHGFERFAKGEKDFRALYAYNGQVCGWHVRRITRREIAPAVGSSTVVNKWRIRGFMSLEDAASSELVFDGLIEALCDAFRADQTLGGLIFSMTPDGQTVSGLQLDDSGPVMFAGVLCHSGSLTLHTVHFL